MIHLERANLHIHRQQGDAALELSSPFDAGSSTASLVWDNTTGFIESFELPDGGFIAHIDFHLQQTPCDPNNNLALVNPMRIDLHVKEQPDAVTALYLYGDWWTRPAFGSSWADIPKRTQVALLKFGNTYGCLVPAVATEFKATLAPGGPTWLSLDLNAGRPGQSSVFGPLFYYAEASSVQEAIQKAFTFWAGEKNVPLRPQRPVPEMFEYLGWCTWNACYKDLTEDVVRNKVAELKEKNVPVRWILMDDGWLSVQDDTLLDFIPDTDKFPHGFTDLTREVREESTVDWFGVWHALAGYWAGVDPDGPLAKSQRENLIEAVNGRLLPSTDPEKAYAFYAAWHEYLRREGIDFVKVDAQGAIPNHYANTVSMCKAARGLLAGLDAGTVCMQTAVLNCMGMPMEDILSRPASAISRNSDDFFPDRQDSFREHLLQNAYNALYHGEMYTCDWDMFWTSHPDASKHALLRAVSGGPVYCSDTVGDTDPAVLAPLVYLDGRILRMQRPAAATSDCIFTDPFKEGVLKVASTGRYAGTLGAGIAAFNLTDAKQTCTFRPQDVPDLPACTQYLAYDWFNQTAKVLAADGSLNMEIESGGYAWLLMLPYEGPSASLGLSNKYNSFIAVESQCTLANGLIAVLHEQGPTGVISSRRLEHVTCNGVGVTSEVDQAELADGLTLYTLTLPQKEGQAVIELAWR